MILLDLLREIVMAYATQHYPEILDPAKHVFANMLDLDEGTEGGADLTIGVVDLTIEEFNHWLQGWWVIDATCGGWWLGVFTRCPIGEDPWEFPYCDLDAPLPNADFSGWPSDGPDPV